MTLKEIRKILDNTKVYVNGNSKEIQEKLFSFGYRWPYGNYTEVCSEDDPFLLIYDDGYISNANDMCYFTEHENREITADEILSLEISEPSYRPFRNNKECWDEMQKHQPVGWLIGKVSGLPTFIPFVLYNSLFIHDTKLTYEEAMGQYTFADGTPFGVAED